MKTRTLIGSFFGQSDIEIADAETKADGKLQAIHLLNPDERELEDAVETAYRDGFTLIICHTPKTWPAPVAMLRGLRRLKKLGGVK